MEFGKMYFTIHGSAMWCDTEEPMVCSRKMPLSFRHAKTFSMMER